MLFFSRHTSNIMIVVLNSISNILLKSISIRSVEESITSGSFFCGEFLLLVFPSSVEYLKFYILFCLSPGVFQCFWVSKLALPLFFQLVFLGRGLLHWFSGVCAWAEMPHPLPGAGLCVSCLSCENFVPSSRHKVKASDSMITVASSHPITAFYLPSFSWNQSLFVWKIIFSLL